MQILPIQQIILLTILQLAPALVATILLFGFSFAFRRKLGLYGNLFDTGIGISGVLLVTFWIFVAVFADIIAPYDPLKQIVVMKHALPGSIDPQTQSTFLLGGDKLARDVFSRMVYGARIVLIISPLATLLALTVGIFTGLPAGYFGGAIDKVLSFLTNLIMAFPIILIFYLLVSPGILETPIPYLMAGFLFIFPVLFFFLLFTTRYRPQPALLTFQLAATSLVSIWLFATFVFDADPFGLIRISPSTLNIFVAVAFVSSPSVFRIVRGLVLDIKTREYVAAAQTRGEGAWYLLLWEILPNARGPLIVDACLRIGYTTIFLGALGYFGLGMPPESPDWGTSIKDASSLLRIAIHPVFPPIIALMTFVLGLNLLADALREQSMKD